MQIQTASLLAAFLLASTALGQAEFRWEQNDQMGVKILVHKKLFPVPLKLGESDPHERVRYLPKDPGDYLFGRLGTYEWYCDLMEFPKAGAKPADATGTGSGTGTASGGSTPAVKSDDPRLAEDFRQWVTEKDRVAQDRKFVVKGNAEKGKRGSPDFQWWEYTDTSKVNAGGREEELIWYSTAAVYEQPNRQIVVVAKIPLRKGDRPDSKMRKWLETMCQSLVVVEVDTSADTDASKRDEFANTPERKAELDKAKANIQNLKGWDYFTSPNYIILYSWNPEKPTKQRDAYKFAKDLVDGLEEMRARYVKEFPPHEKMLQLYSVLRICDNAEEFMKYGSTTWGVVGWFSPGSKELVVFDDKQRYYGGDKDVVATTMHEGWHQYAHTYFGEKAELHRWFDEGHGDYFGSWIRKGRNWNYEVDKGRYQGVRAQVAQKTFIPVRELVAWERSKFYGSPRVVDHYEQAYSIIDFLRRGPERLGSKFDPAWSSIIDKYRATMLETADQKKSVEKAFEGVDWDAFESLWVDWVSKYMK